MSTRRHRLHGISRDVFDRYTKVGSSWDYDVVEVGDKCNMTDLTAALVLDSFRDRNRLADKRIDVFAMYCRAFEATPIDLILPKSGQGPSYHLAVAVFPTKESRDWFADYLVGHGIGVSLHFKPIPMFSAYNRYSLDGLPVCTSMYDRVLSLPMSPFLDGEEILYLRQVIKSAAKGITSVLGESPRLGSE